MIEIAGAPDRIPRPELVRLWISRVHDPSRFRFTAVLSRQFTSERGLDQAAVEEICRAMKPLAERGMLGAFLMRFPENFAFHSRNRDHLVRLRRVFHEFPLAAELPHESWLEPEAMGMLIDYHVGFCNRDALPGSGQKAYLTTGIAYFRLGEGRTNLYSFDELEELQRRVARIRRFATGIYVVFANSERGGAVLNALQMQMMLEQELPSMSGPRQDRLFAASSAA